MLPPRGLEKLLYGWSSCLSLGIHVEQVMLRRLESQDTFSGKLKYIRVACVRLDLYIALDSNVCVVSCLDATLLCPHVPHIFYFIYMCLI